MSLVNFFQEPKKIDNQGEKNLNDIVYEAIYGWTQAVKKIHTTESALTKSLGLKEGVDPTYLEIYRKEEARLSNSCDRLERLQQSMTQDTANREPIVHTSGK
jgi:hypothetical protein